MVAFFFFNWFGVDSFILSLFAVPMSHPSKHGIMSFNQPSSLNPLNATPGISLVCESVKSSRHSGQLFAHGS